MPETTENKPKLPTEEQVYRMIAQLASLRAENISLKKERDYLKERIAQEERRLNHVPA